MDRHLFFHINHEWIAPWLDTVMATASSFDAWFPFVVVGVVYILWRGGFRGRTFVLCAALVTLINDGFLTQTLKPFAGRPRPFEAYIGVRQVDLAPATPRMLAVFHEPVVTFSTLNLDPPLRRSYPSGHTANNMALAVLFLVFFPRRGWLYAPVAILVSYSRIYTGSHWPSDVVGSTMQGAGVALLVCALLAAIWRHRAPDWFPNLAARHPELIPVLLPPNQRS